MSGIQKITSCQKHGENIFFICQISTSIIRNESHALCTGPVVRAWGCVSCSWYTGTSRF